MSLRIQQLLVSLHSVIDKYCGISPAEEPYILITKAACDQEYHTKINIEEHINSATAANKRGPLMHYVLYGLTRLKPIIEDPNVFEEEVAKNLQQDLIRFLVNIKRLLETSQSTQLDIQYDNKTVPIYGCLKESILGGGLCRSGDIIQGTLFSVLNLPANAKECDIERYVIDAFNEYQCEYLLQENKYLREVNKSILKELQSAKKLLNVQDAAETEQMKAEHRAATTGVWSTTLSIFAGSSAVGEAPARARKGSDDIFNNIISELWR